MDHQHRRWSPAFLPATARLLPRTRDSHAAVNPRRAFLACAANARPTPPAPLAKRPRAPASRRPPNTIAWRASRRLVRAVALSSVLALLSVVVGRVAPAAAAAAAPVVAAGAELEPFYSGLTASFLLILASEIGDKTFFISALLALKYSRSLVFIGTMGALGIMTVISVLIGQVFHALPSSLNSTIPFDDYAAVALLVWFGFTNIRDSLTMSPDEEDEEFKDAQETIEVAEASAVSDAQLEATGPIARMRLALQRDSVKVVVETFSLVFLAEWGDKSMLATVALAAAKSPIGVVVGGISGHLVATVIAVVGGSILGKYISEKNARLIGGVLFLVFAVLTLFGLY